MVRAVVYLDRDGTINEDVGYIGDPDRIRLLEGAARAIRRLNTEGVKVIVITNQSGVARGLYTEDELDEVNRRLVGLLEAEGAHLDGVYYCPHHPDDGCGCRKPEAGLVKKAAAEHGLSALRSYVVGDKASDIELAANIGAEGILVLTGMGKGQLEGLRRRPAFIARDLGEAVDWIVNDLEE